MKQFLSIALALFLAMGLASCEKTDPAKPAKQEYIEADITSVSVDVFARRDYWQTIYVKFTEPVSQDVYDVSLGSITNPLLPDPAEYANCRVNMTGFNLFTSATRIVEPDTPSGQDEYFVVVGVNDSLDLTIDLTSATPEETGYLETKKMLLHFTPETRVAFQENKASSITPYLQPGGLADAKLFYEELLSRTLSNNSLIDLFMEREF